MSVFLWLGAAALVVLIVGMVAGVVLDDLALLIDALNHRNDPHNTKEP